MNKRYENMELNGKQFIFDNKVKMFYPMNYRFNDIWDAYERPSSTKVEIWREWAYWFMENDGYCGINSRNCNFFLSLVLYVIASLVKCIVVK